MLVFLFPKQVNMVDRNHLSMGSVVKSVQILCTGVFLKVRLLENCHQNEVAA